MAAQALSNWTEIAKGRAKRDPDKSGESSSSASSASVRAGQATTTSTRTLRAFFVTIHQSSTNKYTLESRRGRIEALESRRGRI